MAGFDFSAAARMSSQVLDQVTHVFAQIRFAYAHAGSSHDETARRNILFRSQHLDKLAQTVSFAVGFDLARDPHMFDGGHVDQKTTRQRDVRSDAGAFLGNRFFGNLDKNFLSFIKQIRNRWLLPISIPSLRAGIIARTLLPFARVWFRRRPASPAEQQPWLLQPAVMSVEASISSSCPLVGASWSALPLWALVLKLDVVAFCHRVASRIRRESDFPLRVLRESSRRFLWMSCSPTRNSAASSPTLLARLFVGAFLLADSGFRSLSRLTFELQSSAGPR